MTKKYNKSIRFQKFEGNKLIEGKYFMKKVLMFFLFTSLVTYIFSFTIIDQYIGAAPTHPKYVGEDIIGSPDLYDITKLDINVDNNVLNAAIHSNYFDNIGSGSTLLGDLFISTDGYSPVIPSEYDEQSNGEDWEYVITLDDHSGNTTSGSAYLYSVDDQRIISSFAPGNFIFRANQEVLYDNTGLPYLEIGTWSLNHDFSYLEIAINIVAPWLHIQEFGFHWGMTCANDIIEGKVNIVPEPLSFVMFGVGLLGFIGFWKKK
ncbi:hypothetical protein BVX93_02265 [bacterium B13(2017)]|nr:hypothetical protein BVX93_02265 [bacterium B13(2017)]